MKYELQTLTSTLIAKQLAFRLTPSQNWIDKIMQPINDTAMTMAITLSKDNEFIVALNRLTHPEK